MAELPEMLAQLPGNLADLATNATEATTINLTRNGEPIYEEDFQPTFTYAIFGDEETIVGYEGLSIHLTFRAHDLQPTLNIQYKNKTNPKLLDGDVREQLEDLMDVEGKIAKFLPDSAFSAQAGASNGSSNGTSSSWSPPGERAHTYQHEGRNFEIWRSSLSDPRAFEILNNMRILIPFFIEGGTVGFLEEASWSMERWKLFLLYEVSGPAGAATSYTLAGFSTSYRVWVFPSGEVAKMAEISHTLPPTPEFDPESSTMPSKISPLETFSRERISQFIILPSHQGASHGSRLYNAMTSLFRSDPLCFEITVEEPNEAFDVLRDLNDMAYLTSQHSAFSSLNLPSQIPHDELRRPSWVPDMVPSDRLLTLRANAKLAPRQFQRLVEIHLLGTIPKLHRNPNPIRISRKANAADDNDRKYYFWRLMVKERLFIRNKDSLIQLEEGERVPKLEEILPGVIGEYEERIEAFEKRKNLGLVRVVEEFCGGGASGVGKGRKVVPKPKKRKIVADEDDEDESSAGEAKRSRMEKGKGKRAVVRGVEEFE